MTTRVQADQEQENDNSSEDASLVPATGTIPVATPVAGSPFPATGLLPLPFRPFTDASPPPCLNGVPALAPRRPPRPPRGSQSETSAEACLVQSSPSSPSPSLPPSFSPPPPPYSSHVLPILLIFSPLSHLPRRARSSVGAPPPTYPDPGKPPGHGDPPSVQHPGSPSGKGFPSPYPPPKGLAGRFLEGADRPRWPKMAPRGPQIADHGLQGRSA